MSMSECARPGCFIIGCNKCSGCLREPYCSGGCQKADWKEHKLICKTLKKLSNELQPYTEVNQIIVDINNAPLEGEKDVRLLGHVLSYAKFQFGISVPGKSYYERGNSNQIDKWDVEIENLWFIYRNLANLYFENESLSMITKQKMMALNFKKMLEILGPWCVLIGSVDANRIDSLNTDQVNKILYLSSVTECSISELYGRRTEFNLAENHCQRALSQARRYKGEEKTNLMTRAFTAYSTLRRFQNNDVDSVKFAEEAYNCVAEAYNPVHPEVQKAAAHLIECLIHKGDWVTAHLYSQVTLDSLRDPANNIDQNSDEVAHGYYNLAKATNRLGVDLKKAETLARESYRIRLQLWGIDHQLLGIGSSLLGTILTSQGNLGDENQKLQEHALAVFIRNEGPDGLNTGSTNANLVAIHYNRFVGAGYRGNEHLRLAKGYCKESVRIFTEIYGSNCPQAMQYSSLLLSINRGLSMP